jgi:hypothetical protein
VLLDPPGRPGCPQGLPHGPYVQAVDAALLARGIPPGLVRANINSLRWGLTGYMLLQWDASRTHGRGGIRLNWEERKGWSYALLGLSDVLLSGVLTSIETSASVRRRAPRRRAMHPRCHRAGNGSCSAGSGTRLTARSRSGRPAFGPRRTGRLRSPSRGFAGREA